MTPHTPRPTPALTRRPRACPKSHLRHASPQARDVASRLRACPRSHLHREAT